jgi:hypothetical protein
MAVVPTTVALATASSAPADSHDVQLMPEHAGWLASQ